MYKLFSQAVCTRTLGHHIKQASSKGGHKRDTHATVYLYQKEDTPSHQIQKAIGLRDALLGFWKFLEEYVHG